MEMFTRPMIFTRKNSLLLLYYRAFYSSNIVVLVFVGRPWRIQTGYQKHSGYGLIQGSSNVILNFFFGPFYQYSLDILNFQFSLKKIVYHIYEWNTMGLQLTI